MPSILVCPEACTLMMSLWYTLSERRYTLSFTRCTVRSFPGITEEENIIVSSFFMVMYLWLPAIILGRAAISSPWAPVQMMMTLLSGYSWALSTGIITPLGTIM